MPHAVAVIHCLDTHGLASLSPNEGTPFKPLKWESRKVCQMGLCSQALVVIL